MNWVILIYGILAGACVFLAATRGRIWWRERRAWAHLAFVVCCVLPISMYWAGSHLPWMMTLSLAYLAVALGLVLGEDLTRSARMTKRLTESETALRASERRLEAAGVVAWEWDVSRDEVWMGARDRAKMGFTTDEPIDRERLFHDVHPDDRAAMAAEMQRVLDHGGRYECEYRCVLPGGSVRWISDRGRAEMDTNGRVARVRGVSVDVTRRVESEESLAAQRRQLGQLSRTTMHGELSGSLAHELNQPLTSILSNAQTAQRLLAREPVDAALLRDILDDIVTADKHASEVVRRVRALVKNDEQVRQREDLNEVVNETLRLLRTDLQAQGVRIETDLAATLPGVIADRVQLQQVLLNLTVNACDAMSEIAPESRRIVIRTEVVSSTVLGVSVEDSGTGIAPEMMGKVFDAFRTTKTKGLGLGLSVCRTIIAAHGGALWATNNPTRGSTFRFTLPTSEPHP